MLRPARLAAPALGLILSVAAPNLAAAKCGKDTDCKGDRLCDAGKCVDPQVAAERRAERDAEEMRTRFSTPLMVSGIVALPLAVAAGVVSAAVAVTQGECDSATSSCDDYTPTIAVMAVSGGILLVFGVTAIIVGAAPVVEDPGHPPDAPAVSVLPWWSPEGGGLAVLGRF